MPRLTICSHLRDFQILECLRNVAPASIEATARFDGAPRFLGLEAMAQLAAFHARHRMHFKRHAFLLKVTHCQWPRVDRLEGRFDITAKLQNQGSNGFAYGIESRGPRRERLAAQLLIGAMDYDDRFGEAQLQTFYQHRFERLRRSQPATRHPKP